MLYFIDAYWRIRVFYFNKTKMIWYKYAKIGTYITLRWCFCWFCSCQMTLCTSLVISTQSLGDCKAFQNCWMVLKVAFPGKIENKVCRIIFTWTSTCIAMSFPSRICKKRGTEIITYLFTHLKPLRLWTCFQA